MSLSIPTAPFKMLHFHFSISEFISSLDTTTTVFESGLEFESSIVVKKPYLTKKKLKGIFMKLGSSHKVREKEKRILTIFKNSFFIFYSNSHDLLSSLQIIIIIIIIIIIKTK
jgi:hypothetical protein